MSASRILTAMLVALVVAAPAGASSGGVPTPDPIPSPSPSPAPAPSGGGSSGGGSSSGGGGSGTITPRTTFRPTVTRRPRVHRRRHHVRPAPPAPALHIQTLPVMAGVQFTFDGRDYRSDAKGLVTIPVSKWKNLGRRIVVADRQLSNDRIERFSRWYGDLTTYRRRSVVRALFQRFSPVTFGYVDLQGKPVEPGRIRSVTIKSATGLEQTIPGADITKPQWLQAERYVSLGQGLLPKQIYWTVQSVEVLGSNVVNASQQRFYPVRLHAFGVQLLFYAVRFSVSDALFGSAAGSKIRLQFPDGHFERFGLAGNGTVVLPSLPRGTYNVIVEGNGFSFKTPISVSRAQNATLQVVTYVDIVLVAGLLALLALTLLFVGRPHYLWALPLPRLRRRPAAAGHDEGGFELPLRGRG